MINRRDFLGVGSAALVLATAGRSAAKNRSKMGVLLMNRIAPSSSGLYIANPDGTGERKFLQTPGFDYNASFSADGNSVVFTSERNGDGNSDVFRCRADGTNIQPLVIDPAVDDAAVLSPDGSRLALVSTRDGYRANIWMMDLRNGTATSATPIPFRFQCCSADTHPPQAKSCPLQSKG